jgi:DNA-binding PucR family transcriptional regulator
MLYMVVEHFKTPGAIEIYRRLKERGRQLPEGLEYLASWISLDFTCCYQLMKTEDKQLFDLWMAQWNDLMDFEILAVQTSAEAIKATAPYL